MRQLPQACFSSPKLPSCLRVSCWHCRWALQQGRVVAGCGEGPAICHRPSPYISQNFPIFVQAGTIANNLNFVEMTIDVLKSEVLKLQRTELFDLVQFILQSLKEKEDAGELQTPDWLKKEISKRATEMKSGNVVTFSGQQVHQEIIEKHGFDIPASLLS
jgi:hypothetical protein